MMLVQVRQALEHEQNATKAELLRQFKFGVPKRKNIKQLHWSPCITEDVVTGKFSVLFLQE